MTTDWVEEPRAGLVNRLLVPRERGRADSLSLGVAALSAAAFVAAVSLDWRTVTIDVTRSGQPGVTTAVFRGGAGDATSLGIAYLLGMVALLGLVGAAVGRAELAVRMRYAVSGAGVGLLGLILAVYVRQTGLEAVLGGYSGGFLPQLPANVKSEAGPGILFAALAVLLAIAAVWAAARAAAPDPPVREEDLAEVEEILIHHQRSGLGGAFDVSVRPSGRLDHTVRPDGTPR